MICEFLQDDAWVALKGDSFYETCTEGALPGALNDAGKPAKYKLTVRVRFATPGYLVFPCPVTSAAERVSTHVDDEGQWWLELEPDYLWDGPTWPSPNNSNTCVGALSHDAMYTLLRQNLLNPWRRFRKLADRWYGDLLRQFGAGGLIIWVSYYILRGCGWKAAGWRLPWGRAIALATLLVTGLGVTQQYVAACDRTDTARNEGRILGRVVEAEPTPDTPVPETVLGSSAPAAETPPEGQSQGPPIFGAGPLNPPHTGELREDERQRFPISLAAGRKYAVRGLCDDDCDLVLRDPDGDMLVQDLEFDDVPVAEVTAARSGVFEVEIHMASCAGRSCDWSVGTYEVRSGTLADGDEAELPVFLRANTAYRLWGLCDDQCADLDLELKDDAGGEIASDFLADEIPLLLFDSPSSSGIFTLNVVMYDCASESCTWTILLSVAD